MNIMHETLLILDICLTIFLPLTRWQETAESSRPEEIMESSVDANEWRLEVERVTPSLKVPFSFKWMGCPYIASITDRIRTKSTLKSEYPCMNFKNFATLPPRWQKLFLKWFSGLLWQSAKTGVMMWFFVLKRSRVYVCIVAALYKWTSC